MSGFPVMECCHGVWKGGQAKAVELLAGVVYSCYDFVTNEVEVVGMAVALISRDFVVDW